MYTNIYCSYPYEIVYFMAKSTPLLFSRFGGFLTVSFFPFFLIFLGSECGMPFQSGKKYLSCFLSVLTSKTDSDKPDSHVIFFIFFDGSLWTYSLCFLCRTLVYDLRVCQKGSVRLFRIFAGHNLKIYTVYSNHALCFFRQQRRGGPELQAK